MPQNDVLAGLLWMLCVSAAATLPRPADRAADGVPLSGLAGFIAALCLMLVWPLPIAGIGLITGGVCAWQLLRPSGIQGCAALAGMLAACGASLHVAMGAPIAAAALLAAAITGYAWWRGRLRPEFLPLELKLPALAGMALSAPLLAALPAIRDGWQSAIALNQTLEAGPAAIPMWVWQVTVVALLIGILHGIVVRR